MARITHASSFTGRRTVLAIGLGLGLALASSAAPLTQGRAAESPEVFLQEAIRGNLAEIAMGELAQKRGASEAIRDYGRMLVADHTKARDESAAIARQMNAVVPTMPRPEAQAIYQKMSTMQGTEFDRHFAAHMVSEHQKEIEKYRGAAETHGQSEAGGYAAATLPALEKHLKAAQSLPQ